MSFLVVLVEKSRAIPGLPDGLIIHLSGKPIYLPKKDAYGFGVEGFRGFGSRTVTSGAAGLESRFGFGHFFLGGGG